MKELQLLGEIGVQVIDIVRTEAKINATEKAKESFDIRKYSKDDIDNARAALTANGKKTDDEAISALLFNKEVEKNLAESGFGTGGKYTRAMQAATAAVQGLMNGDLNAALANGAAPFIANEIKNLIPDDDADANLKRTIAHGIANAALALAKGENAAAQATGAMTGEAVGILAEYIYKKQPGELTEQEKSNISAWATLASGLAGGLVGGDTQSAANSAQAGKTTVENNSLVMLVPDIDSYSEDFKNSNDPLYKLTDAYVHELEIRAESGDQGAIIELQQREIAEENAKTAVVLYATVVGGYYTATAAPEIIAAAKAGAITCAENPVLCANQVGAWIIEMLGADAAPAGIAITGSTATAKLTVNQLSELSALKSMQQQGGKVSPEMVSKSLSSKSPSNPASQPSSGASFPYDKTNEINKLIPENLTNKIAEHNTQLGVLNRRQGTISGAHKQDAFLESVEMTGAKINLTITDKKYSGLVEYQYQIPAVNGRGQQIGFKAEQTKTTYDPTVLSDSKINDMSYKASKKAESFFKNNPDYRQYSAQVDGYWFQVTRDVKTGEINNAFITMPPRDKK
ncbi:VENN motif pre-toxin domain-containing protein [Morganella morganii]|uniref:VENN motif pre-toxin domain-containing protein n=1 Tax=Morganella morganii TaxID=582 RepID=UPI0028584813|nr:VENN motif pre-toxin domain-containing protein [Morganella morganii]MDR5687195.1 VENN motif pre-toxin domain-containing protein [Morganella morganii]